MVVDNRGILPASYSISSVRHALRASAGVIDIVVPYVDGPTAHCHWSDDPLVRNTISPTAHWHCHWSENPLHWSEDSLPLVRKSVIGIAMPYGIGPKTIGVAIGPKTIGIGPKKRVIGLKTHCHWSEKVSLPMTLV